MGSREHRPPTGVVATDLRQRKETGRRVRAMREAAGLSQAQLAGKVGMRPTHLSALEDGYRIVSPERMQLIEAACRALN
jgi:transcriptional regulator with XRE-family HTH domain